MNLINALQLSNIKYMASKKSVVTDSASSLDLSTELYNLTKTWRDSYILSGHALSFIKEKSKAIFESLGGTEETEKTEETV